MTGIDDFLFEDGKNTFAHITSEEYARGIIESGLFYAEHLSTTTYRLQQGELEWFLQQRRGHGDSLVALLLPEGKSARDLSESVSHEFAGRVLPYEAYDNFDEDDDLFLLPKKYIKGYFSWADGRVEHNGHYAP